MRQSGGWFSTTGSDPSVLVRMKEDYDGAEPSPTSVSAMNLLTLAHLTGERAYTDRAAEAIASFGGRLEERAARCRSWRRRSRRRSPEGEQIVIVGPRDSADTDALWAAANKKYRPFAVMTRVDPVGSGGAGRAHAVDRADEDDRRQGRPCMCAADLRATRRRPIRRC